MPANWFFLSHGPCEADFNMAMDEALLESMPRLDHAVLRFYAWAAPAASFGYFQRYREVESLTTMCPLVRRPTAGGIVPHNADWTYSLAVPVSDPWYQFSARQSYQAIHEWLRDSFQDLGIETLIAPQRMKEGIGQCFVGYEQYDLLYKGRKIAGAAQRRTKNGLLIQGSVQPPRVSFSRSDWESAMLETGRQRHQVSWSPLPPDRELDSLCRQLMQSKYSQESFNRKR